GAPLSTRNPGESVIASRRGFARGGANEIRRNLRANGLHSERMFFMRSECSLFAKISTPQANLRLPRPALRAGLAVTFRAAGSIVTAISYSPRMGTATRFQPENPFR